MADSNKETPSHLQSQKGPVYWDWWREDPVEIILVVFILVLFFLLPRAGCGVTEQPGKLQAPAQTESAQP